MPGTAKFIRKDGRLVNAKIGPQPPKTGSKRIAELFDEAVKCFNKCIELDGVSSYIRYKNHRALAVLRTISETMFFILDECESTYSSDEVFLQKVNLMVDFASGRYSTVPVLIREYLYG